MPELDGRQRRYLRALAHTLKPVVQIGNQGLTAGVKKALSAALETHELIKVRVSADAEGELDDIGAEAAKGTSSHLAQVIGRTLLLYKARKKDPKIKLPKRQKPAVEEAGQ
jgi:RNA-binding protein